MDYIVFNQNFNFGYHVTTYFFYQKTDGRYVHNSSQISNKQNNFIILLNPNKIFFEKIFNIAMNKFNTQKLHIDLNKIEFHRSILCSLQTTI